MLIKLRYGLEEWMLKEMKWIYCSDSLFVEISHQHRPLLTNFIQDNINEHFHNFFSAKEILEYVSNGPLRSSIWCKLCQWPRQEKERASRRGRRKWGSYCRPPRVRLTPQTPQQATKTNQNKLQASSACEWSSGLPKLWRFFRHLWE